MESHEWRTLVSVRKSHGPGDRSPDYACQQIGGQKSGQAGIPRSWAGDSRLAPRRSHDLDRLASLGNGAGDGLIFSHSLQKLSILCSEHIVPFGNKLFVCPLARRRLVYRNGAAIPAGKLDHNDPLAAYQLELAPPGPLEKVQVEAGQTTIFKGDEDFGDVRRVDRTA